MKIIKTEENKRPLKEAFVLFADDDPFCLDVVEMLLQNVGIDNFKKAKNGLEVLEIVKEEAKAERYFDFMILDCNMPEMDGFEASKGLREMIKKGQIPDVDIIALTANIATADEVVCSEAGMNHYLQKPVKKEIFKSKVKDVWKNLRKS